MARPLHTIVLLILLGLAAPGRAADAVPFQVAQATHFDLVLELEAQGYAIVDISRTFLGRIRIVARNKDHLREIIVSRSTGAILHDGILKYYHTSSATGGGSRGA